MNTEALFLFLILLLGLVLCSFLGGNCGKEGLTGNFTANFNTTGDDNSSGYGNNNSSSSNNNYSSSSNNNQYDNYNHYTGGSTQLNTGSTFYGENGTTAVVSTNSDGSQSLQITLPGSNTPVTFSPQQSSSTDASSSTVESYTNYGTLTTSTGTITKYYGPNGATATIVTTNNGQQAVKVKTSNGTYYYNVSGSYNGPNNNVGAYNPPGYNPPGTGGAYNPPGYNPPGTGGAYNPPGYNPPGTGGAYNPPGYNPPGSSYYSSLPPGIPASQIPPGQEDLYILKSEVVPPVCPACPVAASCPRQEPCPPCPACARCPEPAFDCKKVPNYNAINNEYLPAPVLNDFSQFGM
jgi:hypothetical protein